MSAADAALATSPRGRRSSLGLTIFVLAAAAISVYAVRRADPDLWGYLAYGRLFLERGSVTPDDPFAYTADGSRWVTFEYLAQIALWLSYSYMGPVGLVVLKCVVGGVAIAFLFVAIRSTTNDAAVWGAVFLLCASTVGRYFLFRPQLFTFAFMAMFVAVIIRYHVRGTDGLWMLPVVMLPWANMHGGFLAGIGVVGLAMVLRAFEAVNVHGATNIRAIESRMRPLWITLLALVVVSLVNPNGPRLWIYVVTEVLHGTNRRFIAEWAPPGLHNDPWSAIAITILAGTLTIVGTIAHRRVPMIAGVRPWQWLLTCAPLVLMAYMSVRHVPIAVLWIGPVLAVLAAAARAQAGDSRAFRRVWKFMSAAAIASVLIVVTSVVRNPAPEVSVAGENVLGTRNPCRAAMFIRDNHLTGNLYTPLWWGAYLSWELYPAIRISMDGRNISFFSRDDVLENLTFYASDPPEANVEAPFRHATDFLIVPANGKVLARVREDSRWQPIYTDSDAVLLVRADRAHEPVLQAFREGRFHRSADECPRVLR